MTGASARVLVIGYGNVLRGDDGAGVRAVSKLQQKKSLSEICTFVSFHQLLPEHIELVAGYELVIFIDASVKEKPGTAVSHLLSPKEQCASEQSACFPHFACPEDVIRWAGVLYSAFPMAYSLSLGCSEFPHCDRLSQEADIAVEKALGEVEKIINCSCP